MPQHVSFALADRRLVAAVLAMLAVVAASNWLVQFPINDWLTWGAFTYPVSFLVTDLVNRTYGPARARGVVALGFLLAVLVSFELVDAWRIAAASGAAFLLGQLLDVQVFDRLRRQRRWWLTPFVSSALGSILDTVIFFAGAFAGSGLPWVTWALGDLAVKLAVAVVLLAPFRLLMAGWRPLPAR